MKCVTSTIIRLQGHSKEFRYIMIYEKISFEVCFNDVIQFKHTEIDIYNLGVVHKTICRVLYRVFKSS